MQRFACAAMVLAVIAAGLISSAAPDGRDSQAPGRINDHSRSGSDSSILGTRKPGVDGILRVCADPNNLPFSNRRREGFENRLATLASRELKKELVYIWWSERKGFVAHTLQTGDCDAVMGLPFGMPGVLTTQPYYRSSYMFVYRRSAGLHIHSLEDPDLAELRIGVHVTGDNYAPPANLLARRGMEDQIRGFNLFGRYDERNPSRKIIDAVARGQIDLAIVWGPLAGYFAPREGIPLEVASISGSADPSAPMQYSISIGVRPGAVVLKSKLDRFLARRRGEIRRICNEYGVPQI